ncbi:YitT family protein [Microbacterium sp.]|uniref:YitT family protein n=1 Tax=Microbacterium sp. TaxID=51671 RepID=UPI003F9D0F4F
MPFAKQAVRAKRRFAALHPIYAESFHLLAIVAGAACVAVGLEFFLVPNGLLDGGITGVAILLSNALGWPLGALLAILNTPFIALAWKYSGWKNAARTTVGVAALSGLTFVFHHSQAVTQELVLALGYGGVLLGIGVGVALRYGGALDGIESLAHVLSEHASMDIDKVILVFNFALFVVAAFVVSPDRAMASFLLFYVVVAPMVSKITGSTSYKTVQIITAEGVELAQALKTEFKQRVLIGEKTKADGSTISTVTTYIPKLEESLLLERIEAIDPDAFVIVNDATTLIGFTGE